LCNHWGIIEQHWAIIEQHWAINGHSLGSRRSSNSSIEVIGSFEAELSESVSH
jgi:hypothetical protein